MNALQEINNLVKIAAYDTSWMSPEVLERYKRREAMRSPEYKNWKMYNTDKTVDDWLAIKSGSRSAFTPQSIDEARAKALDEMSLWNRLENSRQSFVNKAAPSSPAKPVVAPAVTTPKPPTQPISTTAPSTQPAKSNVTARQWSGYIPGEGDPEARAKALAEMPDWARKQYEKMRIHNKQQQKFTATRPAPTTPNPSPAARTPKPPTQPITTTPSSTQPAKSYGTERQWSGYIPGEADPEARAKALAGMPDWARQQYEEGYKRNNIRQRFATTGTSSPSPTPIATPKQAPAVTAPKPPAQPITTTPYSTQPAKNNVTLRQWSGYIPGEADPEARAKALAGMPDWARQQYEKEQKRNNRRKSFTTL